MGLIGSLMQTLFFKHNFLKMEDLYLQSIRIFAFKYYKGWLPSGVSSLFQQIPHQYNTRNAKSKFFLERCDQRSIKYIAPKYWNLLPAKMKDAPSIACFKTMSKNSLLAPYGSFKCQVRQCPSCLN